MENAKSIGEVQVKLEAANEQFGSVWSSLHREGLIPEGVPEKDERGHWIAPRLRKWPIGSYAYHLAAAHQYVYSCWHGMIEFVGTTEGQLCPYEDCAHDLAIELGGWCKCGKCGRPFYATEKEDGLENWHCRKPNPGEQPPEKGLLICRDLGASWATPN